MNTQFWQGKRVFLTGHTGFKGSWLSLWLQEMGAELKGFALEPPTKPSLFEAALVGQGMESEIGDIRNYDSLRRSIQSFKPEIVFHMAAQPLVRLSYEIPMDTYATNVMGTVHLLEAVRKTGDIKAVVNITSDKCYENKEWPWGYRETEAMGGHDPYSNSKGCAELVASAYRNSFFNEKNHQIHGCALASVRAGNVIGGGDWAADRLIPDTIRAITQQKPVVIRNPDAIRPWQHVLEPLSGYLTIAEKLYEKGPTFADGWNFGPNDEDAKPVRWIVDRLTQSWGEGARWIMDSAEHPHEAHYLKLDCSKAKMQLDWQPRWQLAQALDKIIEWHKAHLGQADMRAFTLKQISDYQADKRDSLCKQ